MRACKLFRSLCHSRTVPCFWMGFSVLFFPASIFGEQQKLSIIIVSRALLPVTKYSERFPDRISCRLFSDGFTRSLSASFPLSAPYNHAAAHLSCYIKPTSEAPSSSIGGLVVKLAVAIGRSSSDNIGQPRVRFPADALK